MGNSVRTFHLGDWIANGVGIGQEPSENTRPPHPPQNRTCRFPASGSSESQCLLRAYMGSGHGTEIVEEALAQPGPSDKPNAGQEASAATVLDKSEAAADETVAQATEDIGGQADEVEIIDYH